MIVYGDLLFIINAVADYLILTLVKQDLFPWTKKYRVLKGAVFSSITYIFWHCIKVYLPEGIGAVLAVSFVVMILLWTFRIRSLSLFLKTVGVIFFYLCVLGGFSLFLYGKVLQEHLAVETWWWFLLLSMMIFTGVLKMWKNVGGMGAKCEKNIYEVEICRLSGTLHCLGMYDSGNLLVSQITGKGVCVLSMKEAETLLNEKEREILAEFSENARFPWGKMAENLWSGFYPIRYSSVGNENDWMPGVIAEHIIVRKNGEVLTDRKGMIGISAKRISKDERFSVLLPMDIFS